MNVRDVRVVQRGENFCLTLEAGEPICIASHRSGSTLTATVRFRLVSVARYTSPMPPTPRGETISYGPRRVPGCRGKGEVDGIILATFQGLEEIGERKIGLAIGNNQSRSIDPSSARGTHSRVFKRIGWSSLVTGS